MEFTDRAARHTTPVGLPNPGIDAMIRSSLAATTRQSGPMQSFAVDGRAPRPALVQRQIRLALVCHKLLRGHVLFPTHP
jgi:hypothetical protein